MASEAGRTGDIMPRVTMGSKVYKGIRMFSNEIEDIQTMDIKEDDIFICTFPRSGTTLLQELVYLVATLDFDASNSEFLDARFPFLDATNEKFPYTKGLKGVELLKSPRMVKTHFHHFLLPEQLRQGHGRIIYSVRNPKDAITSLCKLFHWLDELGDSSYDDFIEDFINGTGYACPWTRHVIEYWNKRNDKNVLFLKYEDVSQDRPSAIRRIAKFLGRDLTDEDVEKISKHCSLENMKTNKMTNFSYIEQYQRTIEDCPARFINKGKLGTWRELLTEDQSARIDVMIDEVEREGLEITHT